MIKKFEDYSVNEDAQFNGIPFSVHVRIEDGIKVQLLAKSSEFLDAVKEPRFINEIEKKLSQILELPLKHDSRSPAAGVNFKIDKFHAETQLSGKIIQNLK